MATADLSALDIIAAALNGGPVVQSVANLPPDWRHGITAAQLAGELQVTERQAQYILVDRWRRGKWERRAFRGLTPNGRAVYVYREKAS